MTDFKYYSYSQVNDMATCERKHYWSYRESLTSRMESEELRKGTLFHAALQDFYRTMQAGGSKDECISAAKAVISRAHKEDDDLEFIALELYGLVLQYANYYYNEDKTNWEIFAVEETLEFPELEFLFIPDLIVRDKTGKDKGKFKVVDFKTTKNFWSQRQKDTAIQIPKYIYALRTIPEYKNIELGTIGQIRTLSPKSAKGPADLLRRDRVETTPVQLDNIWRQHIKFVNRIKAYESLSKEEHFAEAVPSLTYSDCRFCKFSDICTMANQGRSFEVTKQTQFKKKES